MPVGAPGAPARGAERVERLAARRPPPPRDADFRAGALRRAGFFAVFFLAMVSSPGMALGESTESGRRQRRSTICRLQPRPRADRVGSSLPLLSLRSFRPARHES